MATAGRDAIRLCATVGMTQHKTGNQMSATLRVSRRRQAPVMLKKLILLCCLVVLGVTPPVQAESWVSLEHTPGKFFFQIDMDSVIATGAGQYAATWRSGSRSLENPYFVEKGVVDCFAESVELTTSSYIETDPILVRYRGSAAVTDYAAGTRTSGKSVTRISENDQLERYQFPSGSGPLAKLIRLVCQQDYFPIAKREAAAVSFQTRLGCGSPTWKDSPLCDKDPAMLETLYSLFMRLGQVKEVCAVEQGQVDAVLKNWILSVIECQEKPQGCGMSLLQSDLHGLGRDLASAASKQSCDSFQRSVASAAEDTERRAALTRHEACLKQKIPALDDRFSSAETIARAVFGACRSELPISWKHDPAVMENLLPALTAKVLEFRQLLRKRPPTQKRAPKPKIIQG